MRFAAAICIALMSAGGPLAMDGNEAAEFLQGTWKATSETWIFSESRWQQFVGGVVTDTTFTTEALPSDMFILVSGHSGRRYVVHTNPEFGSMTIFAEGETKQLGFFTKQKSE